MLSGRACSPVGENCYIAAHDAKTGKELWRFRTAAQDSDPGGASWAGSPEAGRMAATWGLPGGYDPQRRLVCWGVANPMPNTRARAARRQVRCDADALAVRSVQQLDRGAESRHRQAGVVLPAPARRRLGSGLHARAHAGPYGRSIPNPKFVKWINPDVKRGEQRDISVDGRRGRRHLRQRSRDRPVPVGDAVPVRRPELPDLEHRRQDRAGPRERRA